MKADFENISSYLPSGNARQREAYGVLLRHDIMGRLNEFDPLLAGTIPIGVDTPQSDLDILCSYSRRESFVAVAERDFSCYDGFRCGARGTATVIRFAADGFKIELFGDATPTREQNAWRHMLTEHAILLERGEQFRSRIIALKNEGFKTEPAFAMLLGLSGDPYEALLRYGAMTAAPARLRTGNECCKE